MVGGSDGSAWVRCGWVGVFVGWVAHCLLGLRVSICIVTRRAGAGAGDLVFVWQRVLGGGGGLRRCWEITRLRGSVQVRARGRVWR